MSRHVPLIRQSAVRRRANLLDLDKASRTLRRLNRKLAAAVLRDDATTYARASAEGARIVGRLRG